MKEAEWLQHHGNGKSRRRKVYLQSRRDFDYKHRKARRVFQQEKCKDLAETLNSNPTDFWRKIQNLGINKDRKQTIPMAVYNDSGVKTYNTDAVLETWKSYFDCLLNSSGEIQFDEDHLQYVKDSLVRLEAEDPDDINIEDLNRPILFSEVKVAVKKAKLKKATGPDHIPSEVLKNDVSINMLFKVMTYCFDYGIVPDDWKNGIISPIFKSGDKFNPQNYRGITLLNAACKIYCDVLNSRLIKWLEKNDKIRDEQNGFRANRSCQDHIYALYSLIKSRMSLKKSTYACFIDAKKAFDRVNRDCLWYKLQCMGIKGKMYTAIKSLYENVACYVKLNGTHITKQFKVLQGVKQGCKISPTLFNIYMNDLAAELDKTDKGIRFGDHKVSLLMYADDVVIVAESEADLQCQLDCLYAWCKKWRLEINAEKTKVMHFTQSQSTIKRYNFNYGNSVISMTTQYKYLGIWFTQNLDLSVTVREISKSASRALGLIISKFKMNGGMTYNCYTRLFESLVQPILLYGACIFGATEQKVLNTVQNKASRFFLGLPSKSSNLASLGDMGWATVKCKQYTEVVRLLFRLRNMNRNRLTYHIFQWGFRLCNNFHKKNLEFSIKKMLVGTHNITLFRAEEVEDKKVKLRDFYQSVMELECDKWVTELWNDDRNPNGNKLRLYREYKHMFKAEMYVTLHVPLYIRRYFAMLRAGSMPLNIEMGRYSKPPIPLQERICTLCSENCIEDEKHFLMQCTLYEDIREELFDTVNAILPGFNNLTLHNKFINLMSNDELVYHTIMAVYKMSIRRKSFV